MRAFHWDVGDNSETIRRIYGEKLRTLVLELEREKRPYAFVAHLWRLSLVARPVSSETLRLPDCRA